MSAGGPRTAPGALTLDLQVATRSAGVPGTAQFRRWAGAALTGRAEVTLRIVGEREGAALNRAFRGRQHSTNVLTFCYGTDRGRLAGDIVLCAPLIRREARAQRKALHDHYAHLVVHALLHLQGSDHASECEARLMESRETLILRRLGIADPYAGRPAHHDPGGRSGAGSPRRAQLRRQSSHGHGPRA